MKRYLKGYLVQDLRIIKPTLKDVHSMQEIIKDEVQKGVILYRSDDEVATNIRSYTVAKVKDSVVGYLALHIHSVELAEIRSLVVIPSFRSKSIGSLLVKSALSEAKELEVKSVFALTYKKGFFERLGFKEIQKSELPQQKIWADCVKCKHFPICDEIALLKSI